VSDANWTKLAQDMAQ